MKYVKLKYRKVKKRPSATFEPRGFCCERSAYFWLRHMVVPGFLDLAQLWLSGASITETLGASSGSARLGNCTPFGVQCADRGGGG